MDAGRRVRYKKSADPGESALYEQFGQGNACKDVMAKRFST